MAVSNQLMRFDADSHLVETPDWLGRYAPADIATRLSPFGPSSLTSSMEEALAFSRLRREEEWLRERIERDPFSAVGWAALGGVDRTERGHALDLLGFGAQLVFSTYSVSQFLDSDDPELRDEGSRAHNRGLVDFCSVDERLHPVGIVPLDDGQSAVELLLDALDIGCRAVWLPPQMPRRISPSHTELEPFWALLAESDTPFLLHVGTGGGQLSPVFNLTGRPVPADYLGGGENMRAKDFMVSHQLPETMLSVLILDGVLERHPTLRGACIEHGAAWVPNWMERLDLAYDFFRHGEEELGRLSLRPSEYVRRQLKFTPFYAEQVAGLPEVLGPGMLMFSSDYPHPEGGRDPAGAFDRMLADATAEVRHRFYRANFAELLGSRLNVPWTPAASDFE